MTFQPVVPTGGVAGWAFLQRTREAQQEVFDASPSIARTTSYFEARISEIETAANLVEDRQLLQVALGAFGLDEDINNTFFIQKVLSDGTLDPDALANRLSDKRYLQMAQAFGFGDFATPRTVLSDFSVEITDAYRERQFEIAIGNRDPDMRLALGLDRALDDIVSRDTTADGKWFLVMGQPPVRTVFETALALPASLGALGLDQQLDVFQAKSASLFGSSDIDQFAAEDRREELIRRFLVQSSLQGGGTPASVQGSAALALLSNAAPGSAAGLFGILAQRV